jgi:hypothetical protein
MLRHVSLLPLKGWAALAADVWVRPIELAASPAPRPSQPRLLITGHSQQADR